MQYVRYAVLFVWMFLVTLAGGSVLLAVATAGHTNLFGWFPSPLGALGVICSGLLLSHWTCFRAGAYLGSFLRDRELRSRLAQLRPAPAPPAASAPSESLDDFEDEGRVHVIGTARPATFGFPSAFVEPGWDEEMESRYES